MVDPNYRGLGRTCSGAQIVIWYFSSPYKVFRFILVFLAWFLMRDDRSECLNITVNDRGFRSETIDKSTKLWLSFIISYAFVDLIRLIA